ncbi:ABC transporter permease [Actinomadura barringtoniae]|uniref:Transport permease protein n=1 Tax=Actinomadura barringtoniae TaxID=1427535 RepID=A0A939PJ70_9ACTN|nr:ABC transporter permease [Actinomadura barringtoniae]MBO2453897.1 ABC transporter permease [Actinomadura barringtoniae]
MTTATTTMPRELPRHVNLTTGLRNTLTLTWRNLVQIKHNPMELVDLSIQPIMFVLLFAFVFGPAMAGSVKDYLPILIPGIIVQNALFASMTTGVGLNNDVTKGVFDRFRSLPIARSAPLAGRIIADTVKQAWSMFIVMVVGLIIGFRIETNWFNLIPAFGLLLAFALLFSWVSVFVGLAVNEPEKVQIFGFTIIFPITFLSNAFIPVSDKYPSWIRTIMEHNPVSLLGDAIRGLLVGHKVTDPSAAQPVLAPAIQALLWGVGIAIVFIPLSMRAFKKNG